MAISKSEERLASFYFAIIGIGYLFPFSAMSQPADYWALLFPSHNILFSISAVFMYTNLVLLTILVFFTEENTNKSFITRILGGFAGQFLALIVVPSTYFLGLNEEWNTVAILSCTAFMALATAFLDSSVIALSGCYPLRCQEALQLGVGLSTFIGCVYRILTKVAFPPTDQGTIVSSLIYFYTGALTIVVCVIALLAMLKMPLSQLCLQTGGYSAIDSGNVESADGMAITDDDGFFSETSDDGSSRSLISADDKPLDKKAAVKRSLVNGLSIAFLFLTTLAVWPALITEIPTYQFPGLSKSSWWPLVLLSLFALMDVVGRFNVGYRFGFKRSNIWIPVLARTALIPLLIMAAKGIYFMHDAWTISFVAILGWSNGWCGSLTILLMNECGRTSAERRFMGTLASFYLNGGLVVGSSIGLLVENLILSK